jgi:Protein of unknown function (DUF1552)
MIAIRTRVTRARFSRRAFLRRVGASAAILPLLHAERARAAAPGGFPKRLITVAWTNGVAQSAFYPTGDDPTDSVILRPLAPLKSKVTLVAGLDYKIMVDTGHLYDGHYTSATMFTGTYKNVGGQNSAATGPSIDQVVSDAVAKQVTLQVPLLNVTVQGKSTSFRADGTRNTGETDPARLFKTLFESQSLPSAQLDALKARRKSVLDYLTGELSTFGARLGTDDRAKLGAHLESIRQLETSLTVASSASTCVATDPGAPTEYQASMKAFADLIVTAIRCDLTRTVSLVWADDGGSAPFAMPFLNLPGSDMGIGEVHAIAHLNAGYPPKIKVDTWYMTQLAYLAGALNDTLEGEGTALDNSLVVVGNAMGEGSVHNVSDIPFILVGGAAGALRTGRVVRVGNWLGKPANISSGNAGGMTSTQLLTTVGGLMSAPAATDRGYTSNNHLLASISNLMDVPTSSFGVGYPGTLTELA